MFVFVVQRKVYRRFINISDQWSKDTIRCKCRRTTTFQLAKSTGLSSTKPTRNSLKSETFPSIIATGSFLLLFPFAFLKIFIFIFEFLINITINFVKIRQEYDAYFYKVFKVYTQVWKFQQENRQKLVDAGLKRWEIGEIASRIAQLYFGQYMRTSEASYLSESYVFYDAILTREYFKDGMFHDLSLANKQLRFISRFITVCLILNRRDMVQQLLNQLKLLLDDCKRTFQDTDFKEWKLVVQELLRFLKADTPFLNLRPLRYSIVLDQPHPDSQILPHAKRNLRLRDAVLSSYHHNEVRYHYHYRSCFLHFLFHLPFNFFISISSFLQFFLLFFWWVFFQVKFSELTLDTFRMLQCLEWEPSGSFYQSNATKNGQNGSPPSRTNYSQEIADPTLPPNPRKAVLYRPSVTHFLAVSESKYFIFNYVHFCYIGRYPSRSYSHAGADYR